MVSEAMVLAKPDTSSVPPLTVIAELAESVGRTGRQHAAVDRRAAAVAAARGEPQRPGPIEGQSAGAGNGPADGQDISGVRGRDGSKAA